MMSLPREQHKNNTRATQETKAKKMRVAMECLHTVARCDSERLHLDPDRGLPSPSGSSLRRERTGKAKVLT